MKLTTGFKLGTKTYKTITRTKPLLGRSKLFDDIERFLANADWCVHKLKMNERKKNALRSRIEKASIYLNKNRQYYQIKPLELNPTSILD